MATYLRSSVKSIHNQQQGFTLIEVMLVIVIISMFAVIVVMSISGVDHRRLMQQREQLMNDLAIVRLESLDQARIFALIPTSGNATSAAGYVIAEYQPEEEETGRPRQAQGKPVWKPVADFKVRSFSDQAYLQVSSLESKPSYQDQSSTRGQALLGREAPYLIWFGNGENKAVKLQIINNNQPVGSPIYLNSAGMASDTEQGR